MVVARIWCPSNGLTYLREGPEILLHIVAETYERDLAELRFENGNTLKNTLRLFDLETPDAIILHVD